MKLLLLLIMGVELVNDSVVFPHHINWRDLPKWSRRWHTQIAGGVTGGEDRATGSTGSDRGLEFELTTFSIQERARLNARLLAARKSGRACCPYWGRGQRIAEAVAQPWELSLGNAAVVSGLVPGQIYWWEKGQWDIDLVNMNGDVLTASGYFSARMDSVIINMTNALVPGAVTPVLAKSSATEGLWHWEVGGYAFFIRAFKAAPPNVAFENRDVQIDCGEESAPWPWLPDVLGTGGAAYVPAAAPDVDVSRVHGWAAAPEAVYQKARNISTMAPALGSAWSAFMGGWVVDLVPGQIYFYVMGAQDGAGMATLCSSAPGGVLNLTSSGSFVAEQNWAVIYAPQAETPGTIHTGSRIVYSISGLMTGVECAVRLHFAEIDDGFDGSVARRQFSVAVKGERSLVRGAIEPYAAAGDTLNAATTVDFVVTPDPAGRITITLTPLPPFFCAGINGVEVFQRTWEVVELGAGSTDNLIKWAAPLKGVYPAGSLVFPVFFGQPKTTQAVALTGRHADVRFRIEEPLGDGVLGVNACPAEVCIPDQPLVPPPPPEDPRWGDETWESSNIFESFWPLTDPVNGGRALGVGDPGQLYDGVLEEWAELVWTEFQTWKAANNIVTNGEQLRWWQFSLGSWSLNANAMFTTGDSSYLNGGWNNTIVVEYRQVIT